MRRRIVTLTVVAAALAISLFGLPFAVGVWKYYLDDERAELARTADSVALAVSDDLIDGVRTPVLPPPPPETHTALYTPSGQLLVGVGPASADPVVLAAQGTDLASGDANEELVAAVPIVNGATLVGVVRASASQSAVDRRTAVTWLGMLGLAAAAVAATWQVARRFGARLADPLERLSAAAEQLGDGDFTIRTQRTGIPEIDRVATTLDATAERIGTTMNRERAFSAHVSHQLRTPLTGLRLQLEAALESPDEKLRAAISSGISSADRLHGTIDDLLALARADRSPPPVMDLDELLDELRHNRGGPLAGQDRILVVVAEGARQPRAAAAAVRQILGVLLDNAVTHGEGTVTVTARDAGAAIAIDVTDQGTGVAEEVDPFARAHESGDGHGIGLALARSLAEAEGGRLVLSTPAPPTFTLLLPVDPEEEGPARDA
jgi:signal transduction histidine kinase